ADTSRAKSGVPYDSAAPYTSGRANSSSTIALARWCFTAWYSPIGRPNWCRVFAYSTDTSSRARPSPICCAAHSSAPRSVNPPPRRVERRERPPGRALGAVRRDDEVGAVGVQGMRDGHRHARVPLRVPGGPRRAAQQLGGGERLDVGAGRGGAPQLLGGDG